MSDPSIFFASKDKANSTTRRANDWFFPRIPGAPPSPPLRLCPFLRFLRRRASLGNGTRGLIVSLCYVPMAPSRDCLLDNGAINAGRSNAVDPAWRTLRGCLHGNRAVSVQPHERCLLFRGQFLFKSSRAGEIRKRKFLPFMAEARRYSSPRTNACQHFLLIYKIIKKRRSRCVDVSEKRLRVC